MTESANGLGPLDRAVVETLSELGAEPGTTLNSTLVMAEIDKRYGYGPVYTWTAMLALCQTWRVPIPLPETNGNFGSPSDPPAEPRYTEVGLSAVGSYIAMAEHGGKPPLPLGLAQGNHHLGGTRPPFDPNRVCDALRLVHAAAPDNEVLAELGDPRFAVDCLVVGPIEALKQGESVRLTLKAMVEVGGVNELHLVSVPPGHGVDEVLTHIANRVRSGREGLPLHIRDIRNLSQRGQTRLVIDLDEPATADAEAAEELLSMWPLTIEVDADLGAPWVQLARSWLATLNPSLEVVTHLERAQQLLRRT
jgi:DNA gyrase/topoisomerase IV subunit A